MPRFLVFSDLHLPVNRGAPALHVPEDADFVVVAGDIAAPVGQSMAFLEAEVAAQGKPVVFVAGNHEHYGQDFNASMASGVAARAKYPGVQWLENEAVVLGGVRFLGATLWTDYYLYHNSETAMAVARRDLNDHAAISSKHRWAERGRFSPNEALLLHRESRAWLETALANPFDGKTVVVTHHAPHPLSVAPVYAGDSLTPAFVSDLSTLIEQYQPDLWVHGHTHASFDYVVPGTKTRVVCNPRGYGDENPEFDVGKVVEI